MKSLLTILLFLWSMILFGQSNDSIALFDSLLKQSMELRDSGKLDSAKLLSKRLGKFPLINIPVKLRLQHAINLSKDIKTVDKAMAILSKEERYLKTHQDYKNLAQLYFAKGGWYYENSYDQDALTFYIKADSLLSTLQVNQWLAVMSKVGITNVLMKSNFETDSDKFDQAALYIDEGIKLSDSIDFKVGSSILLEKKGHYLQLNDRLDEALVIYQQALEVSRSIKYTLRESSIYDGLGKVYFKQKKVDSAAYYFEKHLQVIEKTNHSMDIADANYNIGHFYNQISKFQMAKNHLEKARGIIDELPMVRKEYPYNIQNELALAYTGLNNHKKALASLNIANKLRDEVYNIRKSESIRELETRYRTEKKEQEIALLKTKNQLSEEQKKSQLDILLGGIGLTSLAGILLFVLYKNRQRTTKKLQEIDALKTNFFTNISHEFRTPLTLISAPIQESLDEPNLSVAKRKHLEIAQRSVEKLSSLVDQLLELSKIDSGNRQLILEKNNPTQFISAWSESFQYLAEQKQIDFNLNIKNKKVSAWFDREALENIVVNLLGNALKYTPEKGRIDVKAIVKQNILTLAVGNTGLGLTKSQIKTIFNRFYQTDGHNEGAGVGLSLVKELVELHNGSIVVQSTPNKWTSFEVSLCMDKGKLTNAIVNEDQEQAPITDERWEVNEVTNDINRQNGELPILLIVEDNADLRELLTHTFKSDYSVIQACDGAEGILKAVERVPDIIVSDLMMPIKDGLELTKTLKEDERTSHIPIILLTAKAGDENELTGIGFGADDYITKPFNHKILKTKAAALIALRKKLRLRYSHEVILKPRDIAITSIDEQFLKKVQLVLDKNLVDSTFTIEEFSKEMHMSRMQLHRKLKALTSLSASEFIRSQRLKLAFNILKSSDINVSEVGFSVGFNDHSYFSKCFKKTFNCTPSDFVAKK